MSAMLEVVEVAVLVARAFERIGVDYALGGTDLLERALSAKSGSAT